MATDNERNEAPSRALATDDERNEAPPRRMRPDRLTELLRPLTDEEAATLTFVTREDIEREIAKVDRAAKQWPTRGPNNSVRYR
jgi:hypothetical protein